jgi:hypothetical protein
MPIYEFYCPDNNRIYQFFARTQAQGRTVPPCPDNPKYRMRKAISSFAVVGRPAEGAAGALPVEGPDDARMEAAMGAMEREMSGADENDPRALGRMIRRMAEVSGERIGADMEEVVRKLEEGADPDSLDPQLAADPADEAPGAPAGAEPGSRPHRQARIGRPVLDPRLHEFP